MRRAQSSLVLGAMLALGVVIGMTLDHLGERVDARQGPPQAIASPGETLVDQSLPNVRVATDFELYDRLARQYDRYSEVDRTFTLVSQAVAPSVVHITADKPGPVADEATGSRYIEETGSGVIVRPSHRNDLFVLTNHHVVAGAQTKDIKITLHDGRVLKPLQSWSDSKADVAVLELGRDDLPASRLGNSDDAVVGTWVLALGSPFGLTHSVSQGIISARNRHEPELEDEGVENQEFLQTDAAINPGNSGGPLVNMKGEVIGINTAIASNGGGSEGVGFSIPINLAKWIMSQLVTNHRVNRGALGVRLQDMGHEHALGLGLDRPRGAEILFVQTPSPAAEAGILAGDVVLRFNGSDVLDINHLINLVSMSTIGEGVDLVLWRNRQMVPLRVKIADRETLLADSTPAEPRPPAENDSLRLPSRGTPAPTEASRP